LLRYYIGGEGNTAQEGGVFPIEMWNKHQETIDGQSRTNNCCEGIAFLYIAENIVIFFVAFEKVPVLFFVCCF